MFTKLSSHGVTKIGRDTSHDVSFLDTQNLILSCIHESSYYFQRVSNILSHVASYNISNSSRYEDWKMLEIFDI